MARRSESFLTLDDRAGITGGSSSWDSAEILLTESELRVKQWAERTRSVPYADLKVYDCSVVSEVYTFSDWVLDLVDHPVLASPGVVGIGQERRRLRLEVADRPTFTPVVALVDVPDSVPEAQVTLFCNLIYALVERPGLGRAVRHPAALESLLRAGEPDSKDVTRLLAALCRDIPQ